MIFLAVVHVVNDAITAILGALLPTLQVEFDLGPTALALIVATFWIASSVTQPLFGALAEDLGARVIGALGVLVGSLVLTAAPLLTLLALDPGTPAFFVAAAIAGILIYASSPVKVVVAEELAPAHRPRPPG